MADNNQCNFFRFSSITSSINIYCMSSIMEQCSDVGRVNKVLPKCNGKNGRIIGTGLGKDANLQNGWTM